MTVAIWTDRDSTSIQPIFASLQIQDAVYSGTLLAIGPLAPIVREHSLSDSHMKIVRRQQIQQGSVLSFTYATTSWD